MQFDFNNAKLGATCNSDQNMRAAFGAQITQIIQRLFFALKSAPTLAHVPSAPPVSKQYLNDRDDPCFVIGPDESTSVYFVAEEQGVSAWNEITTITIIKVGGRDGS